MKTFPLQSLTLAEAQQKQFALVDTVCRYSPGADFLRGGRSGVKLGLTSREPPDKWRRCWRRRFMLRTRCWCRARGTGAIRAGAGRAAETGATPSGA